MQQSSSPLERNEPMPEISTGGLPAAKPPTPKPRRPRRASRVAEEALAAEEAQDFQRPLEVPKTMPATQGVGDRMQLVLPPGWYELRPTGELCCPCLEEAAVMNPVYATPHGPCCPDGHGDPRTYAPDSPDEKQVVEAAARTFRAFAGPIAKAVLDEHLARHVATTTFDEDLARAAEVAEPEPELRKEPEVHGARNYAMSVLAEEVLNTDDEVAAGVLGRVLARVVLGRGLEQ